MKKSNILLVIFSLFFSPFNISVAKQIIIDEPEGVGIHELLTNYLASKDLDGVTPSNDLISLSVDDVIRFKSRETRGSIGDYNYTDVQYIPTIKYELDASSLSNNIVFKHNGLMTTYTFIHMTNPGVVIVTIHESKRDQKSGSYSINPNMTKIYKFQVK